MVVLAQHYYYIISHEELYTYEYGVIECKERTYLVNRGLSSNARLYDAQALLAESAKSIPLDGSIKRGFNFNFKFKFKFNPALPLRLSPFS